MINALRASISRRYLDAGTVDAALFNCVLWRGGGDGSCAVGGIGGFEARGLRWDRELSRREASHTQKSDPISSDWRPLSKKDKKKKKSAFTFDDIQPVEENRADVPAEEPLSEVEGENHLEKDGDA